MTTAPTCAYCGRLIRKGPQSGRAVGTEVFHVACIQRNGVQHSKMRELERRNRELEDAHARQMSTIRAELDAAREEAAAEKRRGLRLSTSKMVTVEALQAATEDNQRLRIDNARLLAELATSRAETESARREAALHQVIRAPVSAPSPVAADPPAESTEEEDASKKRFELMELS